MAGEDGDRQQRDAAAHDAGLVGAGAAALAGVVGDAAGARVGVGQLAPQPLVVVLERGELQEQRLTIVAVGHVDDTLAGRRQTLLPSRPVTRFIARQCERASCRLRFPVAEGSPLGESCPHCGGPTAVDPEPYETHEARAPAQANGPRVHALLDNVRSLKNVGSMFRTADGAGLEHMHLAGFTPTPDHPAMAKTALGAEKTVPWTLHRDGAAAAAWLCDAGHRLWALEGGPRATPWFAALEERAGPPIVLVVGHEVSGVDPRILARCERVLALPMLGLKGSLNVSVAFGVALYSLRFGTGTD